MRPTVKFVWLVNSDWLEQKIRPELLVCEYYAHRISCALAVDVSTVADTAERVYFDSHDNDYAQAEVSGASSDADFVQTKAASLAVSRKLELHAAKLNVLVAAAASDAASAVGKRTNAPISAQVYTGCAAVICAAFGGCPAALTTFQIYFPRRIDRISFDRVRFKMFDS